MAMADRATPVRFVAMTPDGREHEKRVRSGRVWTHAVALWTPAGGAGRGVVSWHTAEHPGNPCVNPTWKGPGVSRGTRRRVCVPWFGTGCWPRSARARAGGSRGGVPRGARRRGHRVVS